MAISERKNSIVTGPISTVLRDLALPLMGISFVQITYGIIDTIWLGRLSTDAVSAVGAVGIYLWFAQNFILISHTGMSVGVSHAIGRGDVEEQRDYVGSAFQINLLFSILLFILFFFGRKLLIGFYGLESAVSSLAEQYIGIIGVGIFFTFFNPLLSLFFILKGNSVTPFRISCIALIFNILLDPVFIFGFGPIPPMGIKGAAYATVLAQAVGTILYLFYLFDGNDLFLRSHYGKFQLKIIKSIFQLGLPPSVQGMIHAIVSLVLNRFIAGFGSLYVAVYSIGSQIESISFLTVEGFASALTTFTGQNFGAREYGRVVEGYKISLKIVMIFSLFTTLFFFFGGGHLYNFIIPGDVAGREAGDIYLKILSISEIFLTLEITTRGALAGLGLTKHPSLLSTIFNILRVPMAYLLMNAIGINGIWWTITLTCVCKGTLLVILYYFIYRRTGGFSRDMNQLSN